MGRKGRRALLIAWFLIGLAVVVAFWVPTMLRIDPPGLSLADLMFVVVLPISAGVIAWFAAPPPVMLFIYGVIGASVFSTMFLSDSYVWLAVGILPNGAVPNGSGFAQAALLLVALIFICAIGWACRLAGKAAGQIKAERRAERKARQTAHEFRIGAQHVRRNAKGLKRDGMGRKERCREPLFRR